MLIIPEGSSDGTHTVTKRADGKSGSYATSGGNVNFDELTSHITYFAATSIPTLSQWGLILLSVAFAVAGIFALRNHA